MSPSKTQVVSLLARQMADHGFTRTGRGWSSGAVVGRAQLHLEVQASRLRTPAPRFTVNFGIEADAWTGVLAESAPTDSCSLNGPIGLFATPPRLLWWQLDHNTIHFDELFCEEEEGDAVAAIDACIGSFQTSMDSLATLDDLEAWAVQKKAEQPELLIVQGSLAARLGIGLPWR